MKIKSQIQKNRNTIAKASQLSSIHQEIINLSKQPSQHTKISTNATNSSLHIKNAFIKNNKTKKAKSKQKLLPTSKSSNSKRFQSNQLKCSQSNQTTVRNKHRNHIKQSSYLGFQISRQSNRQQEGNVSYRQYCLVDKSFVPMKTSKDMKQMQEMMRSTANTFNFSHQFQQPQMYRTTAKMFPFKKKQTNNKQNNLHLLQNSFSSHNIKQETSSDNESAYLTNQVKILQQIKNIYIEHKPVICSDMSVQYSERFNSQQNLPQKIIKQADIQTETIQQFAQQTVKKTKIIETLVQTQTMVMQQQQNDESISDLLLKLQFKHLPHQNAFDSLSKNQKEHYSELLSSLIAKLASSPRKKYSQAIHQSSIQIQEVNFNPLQNIVKKYEQLELQIYKRECLQMGFLQSSLDFQSQEVIDTSMIGISTFLFNFTCYLELHYSNQFLFMIKKPYGMMFKQKYAKLLHNRKNEKPKRQIKVLDEGLFEQFCQETMEEITQYQVIHLKAIFDMINDLLDSYRPYYKHCGEPFPWAVKIYSNICEYAFDQNSMQVIMCEIKQNVVMSISNLAGLLVDDKLHQEIKQMNPLILKRKEREDLMVRKCISQETTQNDEIQCQATKVLDIIAKQIEALLYLQFLAEPSLANIFY